MPHANDSFGGRSNRTAILSGFAGLLIFAICGPSERAAAQGYPADEAARHMTVADGFEVQLVAAEPLVRQPVAIEFDDRGRLWAVQYLQYPNPAGLKRVKVDRYSRTIYDKTPEPPPRGTPGDDRITILEDTDGDGRADRSKDFVSGLNLASGLAFGYGGVFVLNAPYLLFYADRNRDDVPDGEPEVLLTGFGIEDAHSVANSLTWGPDGWLYGAREHRDREYSRHRVPARRMALSPGDQKIRAVLRRGRQFVGGRFRRPGRAALQHQLRRLRHAARRAGWLLLEEFRQARRAAQSLYVRLLRPCATRELHRRPRHRWRHRLPGRSVSARVSRPLYRGRPVGSCRALAYAGAARFDV